MRCAFAVAVALTCLTVTLTSRVTLDSRGRDAAIENEMLDEAEYVYSDAHRSHGGGTFSLSVLVDAVAYKNRAGPGIQYNDGSSHSIIQYLVADPAADAAYTDINWTPSRVDAQAVLDKIIRTPGANDWTGAYRGESHGHIRSGDDFIWLYTGKCTYATNVERCSRGAVAQTNTGYGGKIDEQRDVIDATALAMQFVAGLSAAIALLPTPQNVQHLFRGAAEPPAMVDKLMGMAGQAHMKFVLPGLASTTVREDWAIPFMDRGPCQPSPRRGRSCASILYEITTRQAKDVTFINPAEDEWILPPNREFQVRSITKITRQYQSDYYKVQLVDF